MNFRKKILVRAICNICSFPDVDLCKMKSAMNLVKNNDVESIEPSIYSLILNEIESKDYDKSDFPLDELVGIRIAREHLLNV